MVHHRGQAYVSPATNYVVGMRNAETGVRNRKDRAPATKL
jgi:hypothetical protein